MGGEIKMVNKNINMLGTIFEAREEELAFINEEDKRFMNQDKANRSKKHNFLNEKIEKSIRYRRYQAFFDIANKQGIPESEVFNQISSEAVDDWFVSVCKELGCVISDVHYAVQLGRNNNTNNNEIDIYREYVPTISKELLEKAITYDTFGGEMILEKQKGFDKFIVKMVSKNIAQDKEIKILTENIDRFIEKVK